MPLSSPHSPLPDRMLLVEFAATDRFHRAVLFPFVQGWARRWGMQTRWLRFGVPAAAQAWTMDGGIGLESAERSSLAETTGAFRPDVVLFNRAPSKAIREAVAGPGSSTRPACLVEEQASAQSAELERLDLQTDPLDGFLNREEPAVRNQGLFTGAIPDYAFEAANPAAHGLEPLPYVFLGPECTYDRRFAANPFFEGLDLTACTRGGGCAFCSRPASTGGWELGPQALLERQFEALGRTLPATRGALRIRLAGEAAIDHLGLASQLARALKQRPVVLLLDSRADRLVASASQLDGTLTDLAGSGLRIELALMGIENFASGELQRLNKGLTPETNLAAIGLLFELERNHPETFGFRAHGGLSMVTQTPWTSPTELVLNLATVQLLGLQGLTGKLLTGRLRLTGGSPLTAAAARDGLLTDAYDDPLLDTSRHNLYAPEHPWRFAQPELEAVSRVLIRLAGVATQPRDPLCQTIDEAGQTLGRGTGPQSIRAALALVDCAMQTGWDRSSVTPEGVIEAACQRLQGEESGPMPFEGWTRHTELEAGVGSIGGLPLDVWLEAKPVIKLEPVDPDEIDRFETDPRLPNAKGRLRSERGSGKVAEVYAGRRARDVDAALQLADQLERASSGGAFQEATARMGRLLGYPACCSRGFSEAKPWATDNYFWLHVERRIDTPGRVPAELNPLANPLLEYIPCALDCQPTLERTAGLLARLRTTGTPGSDIALLNRLRNPALIFWDRQGWGVELIPETEPSDRFHYSAGLVAGRSALLEAVGQGDELVLDPECTTVLKKGRALASLSGRAFLWWHGQAFQDSYWRAMLACVRAVGEPSQARQASSPPATASVTRLVNQLEQMRREGQRFAGLGITRIDVAPGERVLVVLTGPDERTVLELSPGRNTSAAFLEAGGYCLSQPRNEPFGTVTQRAAVRALGAALVRLGSTGEDRRG